MNRQFTMAAFATAAVLASAAAIGYLRKLIERIYSTPESIVKVAAELMK